MENIKFICPQCGYESKAPGLCPSCQVPMLGSCPTCGNPIVGDSVEMEG